MAHLKQKQISDSSCKAIIVDTLLETVQPPTLTDLSLEITSLFHILISPERLSQQIKALADDGTIILGAGDHISISPIKKSDFIVARLQETNLRKETTFLWISDLKNQQEVSQELETNLSQALPIFLRSVFIRHQNFDILLEAEDIIIEDIEVNEEALGDVFAVRHGNREPIRDLSTDADNAVILPVQLGNQARTHPLRPGDQRGEGQCPFAGQFIRQAGAHHARQRIQKCAAVIDFKGHKSLLSHVVPRFLT